MATPTQAVSVGSAGGMETKLRWIFTTNPHEFRSKPPRRGRVYILDRSALFEARQNRKTVFMVAQTEGQKVYQR